LPLLVKTGDSLAKTERTIATTHDGIGFHAQLYGTHYLAKLTKCNICFQPRSRKTF